MTTFRAAAPNRFGSGISARSVAVVGIGLAVWLYAAPAASADTVLAERGRTGHSAAAEPGGCQLRIRGNLHVGANPPTVSGPNLRRRKKDVTWARFALYFMTTSEQHLATSEWSEWMRVSDRRTRSWTGYQYFVGFWTDFYLIDLRVEWFRGNRRVGWRAHRITTYNYWDQYNVGPLGPISACGQISGPWVWCRPHGDPAAAPEIELGSSCRVGLPRRSLRVFADCFQDSSRSVTDVLSMA